MIVYHPQPDYILGRRTSFRVTPVPQSLVGRWLVAVFHWCGVPPTYNGGSMFCSLPPQTWTPPRLRLFPTGVHGRPFLARSDLGSSDFPSLILVPPYAVGWL